MPSNEELPLEELSIRDLFINNDGYKYQIPIYQRNYAWGSDEIAALVQDVYDACKKDASSYYYLGTLVTYDRGDKVLEVIDGQQRLTTLWLILKALDAPDVTRCLTYRARKKSDDTLRQIDDTGSADNLDSEERDAGIEDGYESAKSAIEDRVSDDEREDEREEYRRYFLDNVKIIRYKVPKDIDLNQYFEVMNSRGEQLEMHEIVKTKLMNELHDDDKKMSLFSDIWDACSQMGSYVQQNLKGDNFKKRVFGKEWRDFEPSGFNDLLEAYGEVDGEAKRPLHIQDIIDGGGSHGEKQDDETERDDSFQPIIDFPNFLLIVLKITKIGDSKFDFKDFTLDDKELLRQFENEKYKPDPEEFLFNLLKARFFLDNYIVHHAQEKETEVQNPWDLEVCAYNKKDSRAQLDNLCDDKNVQDELVQLLSMFEVTYTPRQRKNYLFYCLLYLMSGGSSALDAQHYRGFVRRLADLCFYKVYLDAGKLNDRNRPKPDSFDEVVLEKKDEGGYRLAPELFEGDWVAEGDATELRDTFNDIYGDGTSEDRASKGVPLFVFNYLDYKIWMLYADELKGKDTRRGDPVRRDFFERLGCRDFELKAFRRFYFSRTRRSLEHFYPQASAREVGSDDDGEPDKNQINCFGNYAMIGAGANSLGSNWDPKTKIDHYLGDASGKIDRVSVSSLKFSIMMQMCKDEGTWVFDQMQAHQENMLSILLLEDKQECQTSEATEGELPNAR